jgi:hypothetical protein
MEIPSVIEIEINVYVDPHIINLKIPAVNIIFLFLPVINFFIFLARAVGSVCKSDDDCGAEMDCKGKRCTCNPKQYAEQINDIYGRPIHRCVNSNKYSLEY